MSCSVCNLHLILSCVEMYERNKMMMMSKGGLDQCDGPERSNHLASLGVKGLMTLRIFGFSKEPSNSSKSADHVGLYGFTEPRAIASPMSTFSSHLMNRIHDVLASLYN